MTTTINPFEIATLLIGSEPLAYKDYPDGSYVIIAPNGMKFKFTSDQVAGAIDKAAPKSRPGRRLPQGSELDGPSQARGKSETKAED